MTSNSISEDSLDLRNLTYLSHIDDNLCCPICRSPFIDPVITTCRHTFCSACIGSAFECSHTCPVDRQTLRADDITMAPIMIANIVNDLLTLCPNSNLGCEGSYPRCLVAQHLKDDCEYVAMQCAGCDDMVLRKDFSEECMHQEVQCEYCSTTIRKLETKEHETQCPQLSSACRHCTTNFARSHIKDHESICDAAIIQCDSSEFGCPWSGSRKLASEHAAGCMFTMLRPVLQSHADKISALELENKTLRRKIDILLPQRNTGDRPGSSEISLDDHTIQLLTDQEHVRSDMERLCASYAEMEIKQSMLMMNMNENLRMKEEMAMMGVAINNLRTQMHWMQRLTVRGRGVVDQPRGPARDPNTTTAPSGASNAHVVPTRPLSDAGSSGDRVKL